MGDVVPGCGTLAPPPTAISKVKTTETLGIPEPTSASQDFQESDCQCQTHQHITASLQCWLVWVYVGCSHSRTVISQVGVLPHNVLCWQTKTQDNYFHWIADSSVFRSYSSTPRPLTKDVMVFLQQQQLSSRLFLPFHLKDSSVCQ